jgi:FdhE protein
VAGSFLGKWFARPPAGSEELASALRELDAMLAERPAFAAPLTALKGVLPILAEPADDAAGFTLDPELARAKLAGGVPLLRGESLPVDGKQFRQRWRRVAEAVPGSEPLAAAMKRGVLEPRELVAAVLAGEPGHVHACADALGLDAGLTATVLRLTLFPVFVRVTAALDGLRAGAPWPHGSCPTCGGWPLLGEFRGLDQSRYLRCGLCATGWEVPRLYCPYCGTRDHERLQFLSCEGEEAKYRAATCDACRGYVKMVTALSALSPLHLLVADALTLHLDLAAAERGYLAQS